MQASPNFEGTSRLHFIIANDELVAQTIQKSMLVKKFGVPEQNIKIVQNGLEAYELAISGNYDGILMDLNMPVMDGFIATNKIKNYFKETNVFTGGLIIPNDSTLSKD